VNTIEEQVLENVVVNMEPIGDVSVDLDEQTCIPLPSLRVNTLGFTYVYLKRPKVSGYVEELTINHSTSHQCTAATVRFACSLHYTAKELDPITGEPEDVGYEDDYVLEDVEISIPNLSP
jgi:coatomer protein complex subunit gamma